MLFQKDKKNPRKYLETIVKQNKYHYKRFFCIIKKMSKAILKFGDIDVIKSAFHKFKYRIGITETNIGSIVISNKV